MSFLKSLRKPGRFCRLEKAEGGFFIVRADGMAKDAFNALAREAIDRSGSDYVALPVSDGKSGYERVFIMPMD
ncbi:hypothetical protein [Brevundimonas sp.]|uniref:hypothetical protein n=1 Tax=Brevundimonas sp. TaxID=1871086 RepID=UPI003563CF3E